MPTFFPVAPPGLPFSLPPLDLSSNGCAKLEPPVFFRSPRCNLNTTPRQKFTAMTRNATPPLWGFDSPNPPPSFPARAACPILRSVDGPPFLSLPPFPSPIESSQKAAPSLAIEAVRGLYLAHWPFSVTDALVVNAVVRRSSFPTSFLTDYGVVGSMPAFLVTRRHAFLLACHTSRFTAHLPADQLPPLNVEFLLHGFPRAGSCH